MGFKYSAFITALKDGIIVDGRSGGLVLGRTHEDSGIFLIQEVQDHFVFAAEMEGWEYLMCPQATEKYFDRLNEINNDRHSDLCEVRITEHTRIINTHALGHDKLIWMSNYNQFIVSRAATQRHFSELEEMNNEFAGSMHINVQHPYIP